MNTIQTPKKSAIEAYAIMQQLAITAKMTVQQLAEANEFKSGYELQKRIMSDLETCSCSEFEGVHINNFGIIVCGHCEKHRLP